MLVVGHDISRDKILIFIGLILAWRGNALEGVLRMKEEWKDIEWSKGYRVSNLGRIKDNKGKIVNQREDQNGYRRVSIKCRDGGSKRLRVHQIVAEAWCEKPNTDKRLVVDHINNDKSCNIYTNLHWVTYAENTKLAYQEDMFRERDLYRANNMIVECNPETKQAIIYESQADAAKKNEIAAGRINDNLRGLTKTCFGKVYYYINMDIKELRNMLMYKDYNDQKKI